VSRAVRPLPRAFRPILGLLIGAAGLIWVFHDVRASELRADLEGIRWIWVIPGVFLDTFGYALQGIRWSLLLRPIGKLGRGRATQAIYAGLFVNEVLPMRVGEAVRARLASQWLGVPLLRVLPSLAVERLFDGLWLALYIGVVAVFVELPRAFLRSADILGIVVLGGAVALLILILRPGSPKDSVPSAPPRKGLAGRVAQGLAHLREEAQAMGRSRGFYLSLLASALPQLCEALALWVLLRAYDIPLSLGRGIAAALVLRLGTAIPGAPGNLGTWQLVCVLALTVLGVDKTRAAGFSLVAFVLLTLPLWGLGWVALARAGLKIPEVLRVGRD
jgi:glycosyltransferase 2 family protein